MSSYTASELEIKAVIDNLINTATNYDVETLEEIYHNDLQVYMLGMTGELQIANKEIFTSLFSKKRDAGDPPMNTWSELHKIDVKNDSAHVLLSRKNDLSGTPMKLHLSIDLQKSAGRWQVIREVIFLFPETTYNTESNNKSENTHV
ncbi:MULTISPECIES: nuclear transport factor 2 family protein [Gammaproteobacteria]|uniref:SnoaL-like domain-containing protein n=1 Tax=Paraferrimonas haliotis TaxID=2013866 RepID=A0AA37TNG7_9GAMM|nr:MULTISPECIES: nuclear transport factor 2 family protein [Gammaproteobacteria]GLS83728.1 hypothetical protein GCM10007894_17050 [Paraferrimonas haliotis]